MTASTPQDGRQEPSEHPGYKKLYEDAMMLLELQEKRHARAKRLAALDAPSPPVQQPEVMEPVAWLAESGEATKYKTIADGWKRRGGKVIPLYAHPSPRDADRRDAERYRWLRARIPGSAYRIAGVIYSEGGEGVDEAIDAAMKKGGAS